MNVEFENEPPENIPSTSGVQKPRKCQNNPSDSDLFDEHFLPSDSEEEMTSEKPRDHSSNEDIKINDFTLVKLPIENSLKSKFFVAQILNVEGENYLVKFLRQKNLGLMFSFLFQTCLMRALLENLKLFKRFFLHIFEEVVISFPIYLMLL